MTIEDIYDKLRSAVALEGNHALIRVRTTYQPAGGDGARIYPPTYPADNDDPPYVIESRVVGGTQREDVLLDSVPSQANRAELSLLKGYRDGLFQVPILEIHHNGAVSVVLTSLELPHRYADAYLRDSQIDGEKFDKTPLGKAFQAASTENATVLFQHDPGSLVFGAWNSYRKGRQAKFPRIYASEIIGWDPVLGKRKAGKMDPLNLTGKARREGEDWTFINDTEKAKGERLSEIGHGNIAPNPAHGGVTITSAERFATLSFAALNRLGFGEASTEASNAARALLASFALLADRLAFSGPSLWLRSGCELLVANEKIEWLSRGGIAEPWSLTRDDAIALYNYACEQSNAFGLSFEMDPIILAPNESLSKAIDFALSRLDAEVMMTKMAKESVIGEQKTEENE